MDFSSDILLMIHIYSIHQQTAKRVKASFDNDTLEEINKIPRRAVCRWVLNLHKQVCRTHQIRLDIRLSRHWMEVRR